MTDVAVVGGGLVGAAIAYGLAREGLATTLLDEGDDAFRASRGNFGLVWVQGKGSDLPAYALWTRASADLWPRFAQDLLAETTIDVGYAQPGGLTLCMSDEELEQRARLLDRMRLDTPGGYDFRMLDRQDLKQLLPRVGDAVAGASYCPHDGDLSPLLLLRALHRSFGTQVHYRPGAAVTAIERRDGVFHLQCGSDVVIAPKVVLAAGLGNARLGPMVGLKAPVMPLRGQILVTEKLGPFLNMPTMHVRQTEAATVLIGDSHEEVGFDVAATVPTARNIAQRALAQFPFLGETQVIRAWGALRVMTPDGYPIYEQSKSHSGAFLVTCHSGVTLAAAHALRLAPALARGELPSELALFRAERFEERHDLPAQ